MYCTIVNAGIANGKTAYIIIISNALDHTGHVARKHAEIVIETLSEEYPDAFKRIKNISTFVDSGTHFVSYAFAYFALYYNCITFNANTHLGILGGHHGKTNLDGIFGTLGTKIAEARIQHID